IRSKTKFWQMIGRGTRLCEDLLGIGQDKDKFLIFDFCNNFEFFRMNPKGFKGNLGQTLSERIFNLKLDLVKELQDLRYSDEEYVSHRNELLKDLIEDVNNLNEDNFIVKMNLKYVQKYKNKDEWQSLGAINTKDIKEHISPLISKLKDDEFAKRFDILMYTIECSNLQGNSATRPIKSVIETAENLSKLGTIPQIQEQKYIIDKV
ncbi:putative type I restriction-modification system, R subunit, partial [Clostridium botulinum CFSAN001627]